MSTLDADEPLLDVAVVEGAQLLPSRGTLGAEPRPGQRMRAVLRGADGHINLDDDLLSRHVLFLGSIGTGKTNAMMGLVDALRRTATPDDVFVVFDTKGDFLDAFYRPGDAVVSNSHTASPGLQRWNLFEELDVRNPEGLADEVLEISTTLFSAGLETAGENFFFAAAARDVFAGVVQAMTMEGGSPNNADLRQRLDGSQASLWKLLSEHPDLAGARHYLAGDGTTPRAVLAFLQQSVRAALSGAFRKPGDFSIREFVRHKAARAVFVEYDIAVGASLLPTYRVLLDLAIKEALGRDRSEGNVFFVLDEFALLPQLVHLADGINFGRSLGLKFLVGAQNVGQVHAAYGRDVANGMLGGFGTVAAFRLADETSRHYVRNRYGANRKRTSVTQSVDFKGVHHDFSLGSVVEDWHLAHLRTGQAVVGLLHAPPVQFAFLQHPTHGPAEGHSSVTRS